MHLEYYWKEDCAPCARLKPVALDAAAEADITLVFVLANRQNLPIAAMLEKFQIRTVPTLVLVDEDGNRLRGWAGNMINKHSIVAGVGAERRRRADGNTTAS